MSITTLNNDVSSIIFGFLKINETLNYCYSCRDAAQMIELAYKFSFVSIRYSELVQRRYLKYATCIHAVNTADISTTKKTKFVSFAKDFNQILDLQKTSVKYIWFHDRSRFDSDVKWPSCLNKLHIGQYFNKPLTLPRTLCVLSFCPRAKFNTSIDFPETLTEISFGFLFNQSIDLRHTKVAKIYFPPDSIFNSEILVPDSIKHITFGKDFDRPIDEILAKPNIHSIKFHRKSVFRQTIDCTNSNLYRLTLGQRYSQPIIQFRLRELVLPSRSLMNNALLLFPHLNEIVIRNPKL